MAFEFFGNQAAKKLLKGSLDSNRLAHAYLFHGEDGLGKKTLANQFAQAILCESKDDAPCGKCLSCEKIKKGIHPDFTELGCDDKKTRISIDDIRELIKDAQTSPNESDYRVFLIKNAETLLPFAANALLKTLEEPPENVIILMTCSDRVGVLKTISSRCIPVPVYPISKDDCMEILESSVEVPDREILSSAISLCDGNCGKAIFYANDETGVKAMRISADMELAISNLNELGLLQTFAPLEDNKELLHATIVCFLDRIRVAITSNDCSLAMLNKNHSINSLMKMVDCLENTRKILAQNANVRLTITKLCANLLDC